MASDKIYLFEKAPVGNAVASLVIPTVISQIISMIYNMADTFFVGRLGDPNQVAAVSIAAPLSLLLTSLANLYGIGASGLMSRFLGKGDEKSAKSASAFGFYSSIITAALISVLVAVFMPFVLKLLGSDSDTAPYAESYLYWVIVAGAAPSLLSMTLSHLVRTDGAPKHASLALSLGGVLNIFLDPLFIFVFDMGVAGAAAATLISNCVSLGYFVIYLVKMHRDTIIEISPKYFTLQKSISVGTLSTGMPGMLQTLLASVSNAVLNNLASGGTTIAAIGIAKKLDTIPMNISIGLAQGIVPLLGYSYSSGNQKRMKDTVKITLIAAVSFSLLCVAAFELFTKFFVSLFITDSATIEIGAKFLRVMCISTPLMAVGFLMITIFQSAGLAKQGTLLSVMRKGAVDIPLMFIMNALIPVYGLAFVQPITECIAMVVSLVLFVRFGRKLK